FDVEVPETFQFGGVHYCIRHITSTDIPERGRKCLHGHVVAGIPDQWKSWNTGHWSRGCQRLRLAAGFTLSVGSLHFRFAFTCSEDKTRDRLRILMGHELEAVR